MPKVGRLSGPSKADGTQQRTVARFVGVDVEVLGPDVDAFFNGPLLTNHDARWFRARELEGTAEYAAATAQQAAPPAWVFDQTVSEWVKWTWTPEEGWEAFTVRLGWYNSSIAAGTVVWRYKQAEMHFNDSLLAVPATVATTAPLVAGDFFGQSWSYADLAVRVPITRGPFDEAPQILSVIERVTDGGGTLAGDAGIFAVSATRA